MGAFSRTIDDVIRAAGPAYLVHVTPSKNREKIDKEGLRPGRERGCMKDINLTEMPYLVAVCNEVNRITLEINLDVWAILRKPKDALKLTGRLWTCSEPIPRSNLQYLGSVQCSA